MKARGSRLGIPVALAVVGAILAVAGLLFATVWRPDVSVTADAPRPESPYYTTTAGLLGLVNNEVTVTASADGEPITLVLGRSDDVTAWLEELPYTEAVGLATWEELSTKTYGVVPSTEGEDSTTEAEPSDAEGEGPTQAPDAEAAEGEQSVQMSEEAELLANSDMWLDTKTGQGTVTWTLSDVDSDVVILAATNGIDPAPKIALTWQRDISFVWIWALIAIGAILIILGLVLYFALRAVQRDHTREEEKKTRRRKTFAKVRSADSPAQAESSTSADTPDSKTVSQPTEVIPVHSSASPAEDEEKVDTPARGREAAVFERQRRMLAEERSQIETTIDGKTYVLPSRRAIREARERGESEINVGGHSFQTGLIPVVKREDAETSQQPKGDSE